MNDQLRSIFLRQSSDIDRGLLDFAIPSLHTLTSHRLVQVTLAGYTVRDQTAVREALIALDRTLVEGPSSQTLQRVEASGWRIIEKGRWLNSTDDFVQTFLRAAFPRCFASKILYDDSNRVPL